MMLIPIQLILVYLIMNKLNTLFLHMGFIVILKMMDIYMNLQVLSMMK